MYFYRITNIFPYLNIIYAMTLDHKSGIPLHQQAEDMLRELIDREEYRNGKLLPTEVELASQLGISRNTLRQAINKLVFENLLVRKKGYGTKVARKTMVVGVKNWLSFSQEMKLLGIDIKNYELHVSMQEPSGKIAEFFGTGPEKKGNKCLKMERVRGNMEYPFVYFVSWFNPDIPFTGEENFSRPLYELLEQEFNIIVKKSKEEISAGLPDQAVAEKLNIKCEDPILIRKRCVYDINGKPIEYNIGYYRADSFTYAIEADR